MKRTSFFLLAVLTFVVMSCQQTLDYQDRGGVGVTHSRLPASDPGDICAYDPFWNFKPPDPDDPCPSKIDDFVNAGLDFEKSLELTKKLAELHIQFIELTMILDITDLCAGDYQRIEDLFVEYMTVQRADFLSNYRLDRTQISQLDAMLAAEIRACQAKIDIFVRVAGGAGGCGNSPDDGSNPNGWDFHENWHEKGPWPVIDQFVGILEKVVPTISGQFNALNRLINIQTGVIQVVSEVYPCTPWSGVGPWKTMDEWLKCQRDVVPGLFHTKLGASPRIVAMVQAMLDAQVVQFEDATSYCVP